MKSKLPPCLTLIACMALSAGAHVTLVSPEGGETISGGKVFTIVWDADEHTCVYNIYYSPDSGSTWSVVSLGIEQTVRTHKWNVPDSATGKGIIRILQDNVTGSDLDDRSKAFNVTATSGLLGYADAGRDISLEYGFDRIVVALNLTRSAPISIRAFNAQGAWVATWAEKTLPTGRHRLGFPSSALPAIPIVLQVRVDDRVSSFRVPFGK
jgi:hypothetical protein